MFKSILKLDKKKFYGEYGNASEYALIIFVIVSLITSIILIAGKSKKQIL